ncbi:tetratricopeptide repeat-containing S1 family peptidase [Geothrix sp.]|uniref:tetratricopeptide repeat-containing S1 family peptidase n=1 Tax=Geothrix sp. TaxID=1962974 RepID=UPI002631A6E6|nr:tetratricopeptide repeat-containing serine protease family protein [Geothrix sp.]WIL21173.1 MAG: tetratricopeptide repeat-containing serine protease family protein [Geothrix sp.]
MLQVAPPPPANPDPVRAQASVVLVQGRLGGSRVQQGSGVVIAPFLVATNAHVVERTQGLTVRQGQSTWAVSEVRLDRSRDLCLLTVPGLTLPPADPAPFPVEPGQKVLAVGYPGGQGPVVSRGRLRGIWHHGEGHLLQSDAMTLPGSSGGGLFDEAGRLLGLTTLTFTPSPRLNFSVPLDRLEALMLQPEAVLENRIEEGRRKRSDDWLEGLCEDPRNWPAWEVAARQWVQDLPRDENAWLALGLALDRAARASAGSGSSPNLLPEGVEAYRRSLALRRSPKTWNNLGVALDLLNRFEDAELAFHEALDMEPGYALAWLNLGCARMNAHRFPEAAEAFRKGLALRPDEADAWLRLAHCQRSAGRREAALASLRIALRYRPLVGEHWLDLGLLLVDLARLDEAREVGARLDAMNPELAERLRAALSRVRSGRSSAGAGAKRPGHQG